MVMERLKRTFSFRKSKRKAKAKVPESSKPHQWQEDERKVREGTCSFQVWYLGCIEVFESRGMQVCEEAAKVLKSQCKGKYQRAVLYVSGDALRVVDEISKSCKKSKRLSFRKKRKGHKALPAILYISGDSLRVVEDRSGGELVFKGVDDHGKGLIVDQTIEKVSFCAPDRNHEKGFAYICRDGTTRRWMCHGFLTLKESGERLSHAVGCAFAVCLERKQKRDKESGVTVQFNEDKTSFTRTGSFRQTTLTERLADPQSAIVPEPVELAAGVLTQAQVETNRVERPHATQDMLYRQGSFRGFSKLQEAASPFKRQLSLRLNELPSTLQRQQDVSGHEGPNTNGPASPIAEVSPSKERAEENTNSIAALCQELTSGLSALTTDDPFATVPKSPSSTPQHTAQTFSSSTHSTPVQQPRNVNPWAQHIPTPSADFWLNTSLTQSTSPTPFAANPVVNGNSTNTSFGAGGASGFHASPQHPAAFAGHARSHSIDSSELFSYSQAQRKPTLSELARQNTVQNGASNWQTSSGSFTQSTGGFDPFNATWASQHTNTSTGSATTTNQTNPFASPGSTKAFEVKL